MSGTTIAVIIACAVQIMTLLGLVWRAASTITELKSALTRVAGLEVELAAAIKSITKIDVHANKIETLENLTAHMSRQLDTVWKKIFSLDKHRAVQEAVAEARDSFKSIHDTDPPEND